MNFDLPASPILNMLRINGRLTFNTSLPSAQLSAKYIFVKAGELIIGAAGAPYPGKA
jgi:hypothetical protein